MKAMIEVDIKPLPVPSVAEIGPAMALVSLGDLSDSILETLCQEWVANVKHRVQTQRAEAQRRAQSAAGVVEEPRPDK